jgi:hypothetical protein
MKKILFPILFIVLILAGGCYLYQLKKNKHSLNLPLSKSAVIPQKCVTQIADSLKLFLGKHKQYNQDIIFLIDMKIFPGKNRFFVYSYAQNKVIDKGLVAHGAGSDMVDADGNIVEGMLSFSNVPNSLKTSLGKYAVGGSYIGQFGKSYLLYGLDSSNSNALERNIVLHTYKNMPENEQQHLLIRSYGCPMVSPQFFSRLEKIIDASPQKILLYIYY